MRWVELAVVATIGGLACGPTIRAGLCPGEVPTASAWRGTGAQGRDSATLKVVPAYVLQSSCPNWKPALEIAKRISGCWANGLRGSCPKCPIPCNNCQFLEDGFFPEAYIVEHINGSLDAISAVGVPKGATDGVKVASFRNWLCYQPQYTEILAKAMVHESIHLCKEVVPATPAMNDNWARWLLGISIGTSDTADLVDECWKNNGL